MYHEKFNKIIGRDRSIGFGGASILDVVVELDGYITGSGGDATLEYMQKMADALKSALEEWEPSSPHGRWPKQKYDACVKLLIEAVLEEFEERKKAILDFLAQ